MPPALVVINVLEKDLYNDCHIQGSIQVPFEKLEQYVQRNLHKESDIVLYCSNYMCAASGQGCKKLKKLGFDKVYAYEGGTAEWYQQGMPVNGPCTASYLQKKMAPIVHDQEEGVSVISMQELARKMHVTSEK